jgi:predicted transcriptional regulator
MAKRRPLTFEELSNVFKTNRNEILKILNSLLKKGKIKKESFEGKDFYTSN